MIKLFETTKPSTRNYPVAIFVGILAGILSAFMKSGVETIFPPRTPTTTPPPIALLQELGQNTSQMIYTFSDTVVNWGGNGVHFLFSIVCAVIYCVAAEIFPKTKMWAALAFGLGVMVLGHGTILPLLHLSPAPWDIPLDGIISEIIGTAIWMFTIEIVRRDLRNRMTNKPDPEFQ